MQLQKKPHSGMGEKDILSVCNKRFHNQFFFFFFKVHLSLTEIQLFEDWFDGKINKDYKT